MIVRTSPADLLKARLRVAEDDLARGIKALEALGTKGPVPPTVRDPLRDLLDEQREQARALRQGLGQAPTMNDWSAVRMLGEDAHGLLSDALGCLEASFVREKGLDEGLCSVANQMLLAIGELTNVTWRGTTIVGGDERFVRRSQLIHLRFPEFTIWALPLAVHEFGHLVAQEQTIVSPDGKKVFEFAEEIESTGEQAPHFAELFADAFASWALGPAYACTAVLLRFAPDWAAFAGDGATHPPDATRVAVTLGVLERLGYELSPFSPPYLEIVDVLRDVWEATLEDSGAERVDPEAEEDALAWIDVAVLPLLRAKMPRSQYSSWGNALTIAPLLSTNDPLPAPGRHPPIADVLNGAWEARLADGVDASRIRRIEARARKLCGLDLDPPDGEARE